MIRLIQKLALVLLLPIPITVFADDKIDWTGLYGSALVGLDFGHVGEGNGTGFSTAYAPNSNTFSDGIGADLSGLSGNLKLGYNKQYDSNLIGVELGATWQSAESKNGVMDTLYNGIADTPNATRTQTKIKNYETLDARFGHIFNETSLGYIKAGVAIGHIERSLTDSGTGDWINAGATFTGSTTKSGYTLGFGAEHKFNDKWALRVDYEYVDFGNVNFSYNFTAFGNPAIINQSNAIHFSNLSAGISYAL
jgi:outer membrane immunogenic protein